MSAKDLEDTQNEGIPAEEGDEEDYPDEQEDFDAEEESAENDKVADISAEPAEEAQPENGSLGARMLKLAHAEAKPGLVMTGPNQDEQGRIRLYFIEGLGWKASRWDAASKKPDWCTAFVSYCHRKAHEESGQERALSISASAKKNVEVFAAAERFIPAAEVFDEERRLRPFVPNMPQPGDVIIWQGHVGLLREIDADGNMHTIEGNTYILKDGRQAWGVHKRKYKPAKNPKKWDKLKGFGRIG